uniref:Uncharacterized protein n=1 Tax=Anguilla anguilla TaxID=7936 RepID=A0A0E9XFN6_ANGAN
MPSIVLSSTRTELDVVYHSESIQMSYYLFVFFIISSRHLPPRSSALFLNVNNVT